ncbi:polysaccharide pyruvyl transferase CsaB [Paraclostridium bifermentans]|uniref:polysaccharide pyruvyl transferase CsaB n=1 Tax=Paraclostridium bifermentans TaxID=1490 RepID=UPI00359C7A64
MRILISGYYGFDNSGDEAILKSIISDLREINSKIDIVVLSNDIEYTERRYKVKAVDRWNIFRIYKELKNCDGLISGGGSLLQDVTSLRSIIYYTSIIRIAKVLKIPTFIYAQGIGPINKSSSKKRVKKALDKVDYITLRDKESLELLRYIGVNKDVDIVPDPVMGLNIDDIHISKLDLDEYITVSVRTWKNSNIDFAKKIAKACDEISLLNKKIVFVPMQGKNDYNESCKIVDFMEQDAIVADYNMTIEEKIMLIKNSKLMIGMRLHSLIFAAISNTPMIGISYDPKVESFLKLINQKCIGRVDEDWKYEELLELSKYVFKNETSIKKDLEIYSNKLKNDSKETARRAINIFNR